MPAGEDAVKHVASGEVRRARAASWSRRESFMHFFIDVMHLQMFPERGSRDQSHTLNRKI